MFIVFEGPEGSGKSTQLQLIAETLRRAGHQPVVTREPGGCPIADKIRSVLVDAQNHALVPTAELMLYAAGRAQHVAEVVKPALAAGKTVLCDRFNGSTKAYQGFGRGLDMAQLCLFDEQARQGVSPDLVILFDLPVERGLARAMARMGDDRSESRFEEEALQFHQRVREGYLHLAAVEPNWVVLDADRPVEAIARDVSWLILSMTGLVDSEV